MTRASAVREKIVREKIAYERRWVLLTNHWYETKGIEVLLKTPLLYQEDFFCLMKYRCKFVSLQITAISQQSIIELPIKKGL